MKTILRLSFLFFSPLALAQSSLILNHGHTGAKLNKTLKDLVKKTSFSYGIKYLGPSLSSGYQEGATYNRTNSGQDWQGTDQDPTASTQLYHTTSLGFQVSKNVKLSYSYTFQEDLNEDIEYEKYNKDGSVWSNDVRQNGVSSNNQRINATVSNIYSNNYFFLMSNFFYERPTTEGSQTSNMNYGLGIQPLIGIFSNVRGLYHGFKFSFERNYYKKQEYNYACGSFSCNTKYLTFVAEFTGYIGYKASDKLSLDMDIIYDWDQKGDQVDQFNEIKISNLGATFDKDYNNSLDNIIQFGPTYRFNKKMAFGVKTQFSVNKPDIKRSAIIGNFNLSI
jgi:hypothetical protein